jgi:ATP-dependent RNA helicase DDX24/MAK5
LDIPRINTVIHYDIARSLQVYIHRSGRTARTTKDGPSTGTALSLVSPEDVGFHNDILRDIPKSNFTSVRPDISFMDKLNIRVKLAKKV